MTKVEPVEKTSRKINLTKKETKRIVDPVFGSVIWALAQGDKAERLLGGWMTPPPTHSAIRARTARAASTGESRFLR